MAVAVESGSRHFQSSVADTAMDNLRAAQRQWRETSVRQRLAVVRRFRRLLAGEGTRLAGLISPLLQRSTSDTLVAEVIPLAEAARFLELSAERLLRPIKLSRLGRPQWLGGVDIAVRRESHGVVLVIAPANYPLFLPGVQGLQALVAGNAVVWKPGTGGQAMAEAVFRLLVDAGLPRDLVFVTDESVLSAQEWICSGVDKVVLTGSASSGRSVLDQCAPSATPVTVELSGCDSFFVLPGADIAKAVRALVFGLAFNGGATCIAPRRVFVHATVAQDFQTALGNALGGLPSIAIGEARAATVAALLADAFAQGASTLLPSDGITAANMRPMVVVNAKPSMELMQADIFAPVAALAVVPSLRAAVEAANVCPYALGASIFGDVAQAESLAASIDAGVVVVNDIIAPTADPRLSFGGRKASGFGKTRGGEGLLEMTVSKSVLVQGARRLRHLDPPHPRSAALFESYLRMRHGGGFMDRVRAMAGICRAALGRDR